MAKKNTRAASGGGSIRQRPDGRWEARVTLGRDPGTGKQVQKSIYGATQKEVLQKKTAMLAAIDNGTYQEPSKITVKEWLEEWMNTYCVGRLKPYTVSGYVSNIRNHINPAIGDMKLQSLRGIHIQRLYNKMHKDGLASKTITNVAAVMRKAFEIARKQNLISVNPCDNADIPSGVKHEIKPLSDADIPLFLQALKDEPMENAFALCLFSGLREGECLGLSWKQVDFDKGTIIVNQQLQREKEKGGQYIIREYTKSNKPRTIKPPPIAFQYLKAEALKQKKNRLAAGPLWDNPHDLVFTNEFGRHYAIFTFYRNFKRIAAGIGRPDARPHDLRHTTATVAIASGADIKSVQSLLGHATASFTLNVYAHTSEQMMEDTAARMEGYFESCKG